MRKYTYNYYNPYEYPDDITAAGTCEEVYADSLVKAFTIAIDEIPIDCIETLQVDGVDLKSIMLKDPSFKTFVLHKLCLLFSTGDLHFISDDSFKIIRNL